MSTIANLGCSHTNLPVIKQRSSKQLLKFTGGFLAVEPAYHDGQHPFARWMKDRDSGQNIRSEKE